jgi:hypothetical protein
MRSTLELLLNIFSFTCSPRHEPGLRQRVDVAANDKHPMGATAFPASAVNAQNLRTCPKTPRNVSDGRRAQRARRDPHGLCSAVGMSVVPLGADLICRRPPDLRGIGAPLKVAGIE